MDENLTELFKKFRLGIEGTSGTFYQIVYASEKGVLAEKSAIYGEQGVHPGFTRLRVITWPINIGQETQDDYGYLEEKGWEPKGGHHVSVIVPFTGEERDERIQEAKEFLG